MDSKDLQLFEEFSNKLNNINLYSKAIEIYNDYVVKTNNNDIQKLMKSIIDENKYKKKMTKDELFQFVEKINSTQFKDDCNEIMIDVFQRTNDDAQINTIKRIINLKQIKPDLVPLSSLRNIHKKDKVISKPCPHCGMVKTENSDAVYVICGYGTKGFDWKGCGFDWCFDCGKKLCKCWNVNLLYNLKNRFHNDKCCKSHALKTGASYPEEYCHCQNKNVTR